MYGLAILETVIDTTCSTTGPDDISLEDLPADKNNHEYLQRLLDLEQCARVGNLSHSDSEPGTSGKIPSTPSPVLTMFFSIW